MKPITSILCFFGFHDWADTSEYQPVKQAFVSESDYAWFKCHRCGMPGLKSCNVYGTRI